MKNSVRVAVLVACLAGCASTTPPGAGWQKEGGSPEALKSDADACGDAALAEPTNTNSEWVGARVVGNQFSRCMKERGWSRVQQPSK